MMIAWVSCVVMLVGALLYAIPSNGTVKEMGRIAFFVGLFWVVAKMAEHVWRLTP